MSKPATASTFAKALVLLLGMAKGVESTVFELPLDGDWTPSRGFAMDYVASHCGFHLAEDIPRDPGTEVRAAATGIVRFSANVPGLGHAVHLEHTLADGSRAVTVYYHMKRIGEGGIELPATVQRGVTIGYVSGRADDFGTGPHLHFGVRFGSYQPGVDPRTERWFYPGYSAIRTGGIRNCDLDPAADLSDPLHSEIIAEWRSPELFVDDNSTPSLPRFEKLDDLIEPRLNHCATRLLSGDVFIAGGNPGTLDLQLQTAEIYRHESGTFEAIGEPMTTRRGRGVQCTTLSDGRVLIAGGSLARFSYTDSAELYDPSASPGQQFTAVGDMRSIRGPGWQMFPQPDGEALVFGGVFEGGFGTATDKIDRFVPSGSGGSFVDAGTLVGARRDYSATQIDDDAVLLVAGRRRFDQSVSPEAERYSILSQISVATANQPSHMPRGRDAVTARLPNGNVLLVGGSGFPAEIYVSDDDHFVDLPDSPQLFASNNSLAVTLLDGRVLLLGVAHEAGAPRGRIAAVFTPTGEATGTLEPLGSFDEASPCGGYAATLLESGAVLITGGAALNVGGSCQDASAIAELFHPGG